MASDDVIAELVDVMCRNARLYEIPAGLEDFLKDLSRSLHLFKFFVGKYFYH